jgi:hypothetical protein
VPPRDPDSRFPAESGNSPFADSQFPATGNRESGIGKSPQKTGKRGIRFPILQCPGTKLEVWVDIVRKVRPIVRHLRVRVGSAIGGSSGSQMVVSKDGGDSAESGAHRIRNFKLKDSRQHPAQNRACCTHTAGYSRFSDLRPIGTPIPVSRPNRETGDFPIPVPGRVGNRKFPLRFRPNRESGERESGISGSGGGRCPEI